MNRISVDLDADTTTGATADTIDVVSAVWQRGGGIGTPVPTMTLALSGTWDAISPTSAGDLDLAIGDLLGTDLDGHDLQPEHDRVRPRLRGRRAASTWTPSR